MYLPIGPRLLIWLLAALLLGATPGDTDPEKAWGKALRKHRRQMDRAFRDPATSPLRAAARDFQGLAYFPPDPAYRVQARLEKTPEAKPFVMPTSDPQRPKEFVSYGRLTFVLAGDTCTLTVYRSLQLVSLPQYRDYLFLPFKDHTNGAETYGGGRYLDLETTDADSLTLDFNYCYNPYCAYSDGWACPVPPVENHLPRRVAAGVKAYDPEAHD